MQGGGLCAIRGFILLNKGQVSYILILPHVFLAVLDVRSAVGEGLRGLACVFLLCNLSTEKVAGLRWVREGIVRIDLPGESLIQRSHNRSNPDKNNLQHVKATDGSRLIRVWADLLVFLCASRRADGGQPVFPLGWSKEIR